MGRFYPAARTQGRHWTDLGPPNAPDSAIMARAREEKAIVFTHDLDFGALLAQTNEKGPSVMQIRAASTGIENIGRTVINALRQCDAELRSGALLIVDSERHRIRLLPLNSDF